MLLARLKEETQDQHRRIEAGLDLLRADFTITDYRNCLKRLFGYYAPWENQVRAYDPAMLDNRMKTPKLMTDLQSLGYTFAEIEAMPRCKALPALDSLAHIVGSMYVLEGSTLGGQVLSRHFIRKFDLAAGGCLFFEGYGAGTSAMWKAFGVVANEQPIGDWDQAVASAKATFNTMTHWMCSGGAA